MCAAQSREEIVKEYLGEFYSDLVVVFAKIKKNNLLQVNDCVKGVYFSFVEYNLAKGRKLIEVDILNRG